MGNEGTLNALITELQQEASQLTTAAQTLQQQKQQLSWSAQGLTEGPDAWTGKGSQQFQGAWTQRQSDFQNVIDTLNETAQALTTLAQGLDNQINSTTYEAVQQNQTTNLSDMNIAVDQPDAQAEQTLDAIANKIKVNYPQHPTQSSSSGVTPVEAAGGGLMAFGAGALTLDAEGAPVEAASGPPGWVIGLGILVVGGLALGAGYLLSKKAGSSSGDTWKPSKKSCDTAQKLLKEYERLAGKTGSKLSPKRLKELNAKRDAGTITSDDLPASIRSQFPGEFNGMSLSDINSACGG